MNLLRTLFNEDNIAQTITVISSIIALVPLLITTYVSSKILTTFEKSHLAYKKRARLTTYNSISYVLILGILYYLYTIIIGSVFATIFFSLYIAVIMIILLRILRNKYIKVYYSFDESNIILSKFDKEFYSVKDTSNNSFKMIPVSVVTSKTFTKKYYLPPRKKNKMEKKLDKWKSKKSLNYKTTAKVKKFNDYLQNEIELP